MFNTDYYSRDVYFYIFDCLKETIVWLLLSLKFNSNFLKEYLAKKNTENGFVQRYW